MSSLSFTLQLGTLLPALLGVTVVRVLVMGHYASQRRVYPGFRALMYGAVSVFLGMAVLMLRAWAGDTPLLAFFTSAVLLAHPVLVYHGLGAYGRVPRLRARTWQNVIFVLLVCLAQTADQLFDPNMERRVLIFSLAALLLALRIGVELPWRSTRRLPGMGVLCLSYLVTAGLQVVRIHSTLSVPGYALLSTQQADVIGVYSVFFRIVQSVLELYVVFAMNSAMLEDDLHVATSRIEHMAQTDTLTGVLNRRGLELLGAEAVRKSYGHGRPVSVILLDLDWFKRVNDTLGHVAGDALLRDVAALCQRSLRDGDVFARYGGEEFVVVAPLTGAREARLLAERLRQAVENEAFAAAPAERITSSFGVASARQGGLTALLKSADEALYAAKEGGRNQVVLALGALDERDAAPAGAAAEA